jgi:hypothetical protein
MRKEMTNKEDYLIDPENLKRDNVIKKSLRVFLKMLDIYTKTNTALLRGTRLFIQKLFSLKDDNRFLKLFNNEYIGVFLSTVILYFIGHSIFLPPVIGQALTYVALLNIVVICGKILGFEKKAKEMSNIE